MNSALEIYKDIEAGSARINPFSDYFQETEENMKTMKPIFEGRGITRDVHVQMPFSCADRTDGDPRDNGCNSRFPKGQESMIRQMEADDVPGAYSRDMYDYSKGVFFDYARDDYQKVEQFMTKCDPLKEDTTKCLERIFECGDTEWEVCRRYIDYCPSHVSGQQDTDEICKYNIDNDLIKKYIAPSISFAKTQPFCKIDERSEECLARYECAPNEECDLRTCEDDPMYVCKGSSPTVKRFFIGNSPVVPVASSPDVLMFERRGIGEFFSK
jgi:hypothetical protein